MKIAINHYGRFELPRLELFLNKLDSFIVTPEIEESRQFITGVERGKFEVIEVTDLVDVERAVNVTDEIIEEYREQLTAEPEPVPQAPPEVPEDEAPAEEADEGAEEQPLAEEAVESEEQPPAEEEQMPSPDIEGMGYKDLQAYALELEKKFEVEINRSAKTDDLREEIRKVLAEHVSEG